MHAVIFQMEALHVLLVFCEDAMAVHVLQKHCPVTNTEEFMSCKQSKMTDCSCRPCAKNCMVLLKQEKG